MPACRGWSSARPASRNTALQKAKEINPLGQTVLGPGIPPLLQTGQGVFPGCRSALPCCGGGLGPVAGRLWPCRRPALALPPLLGAESATFQRRWPSDGFGQPAQCGPKTSPEETARSPGSLRAQGTHRYILHWRAHVANVQLGLMRVQPRHQRRERQ